MAERQLPKLNVAGSIPVSRSINLLRITPYIEERLLEALGCCMPQ